MPGERAVPAPDVLVPHERVLATVRGELHSIATSYSFNTFSHFHQLSELSKKSPGSSATQIFTDWAKIYDPETFVEEYQGGNCVDFAVLAQKRLQAKGIRNVRIVGKLPDGTYTAAQQEHMIYRHTPLVLEIPEVPGQVYVLEPGWRHPEEIPLYPVGKVSGSPGGWTFKTVGITREGHVIQETKSANGEPSHRELDITGLERYHIPPAKVTVQLMRIPRRLELITRLGQAFNIISYSPQTGMLHTSIKEVHFPKEFRPEDITDAQNDYISRVFGIDNLRQYLADALSFRDALLAQSGVA